MKKLNKIIIIILSVVSVFLLLSLSFILSGRGVIDWKDKIKVNGTELSGPVFLEPGIYNISISGTKIPYKIIKVDSGDVIKPVDWFPIICNAGEIRNEICLDDKTRQYEECIEGIKWETKTENCIFFCYQGKCVREVLDQDQPNSLIAKHYITFGQSFKTGDIIAITKISLYMQNPVGELNDVIVKLYDSPSKNKLLGSATIPSMEFLGAHKTEWHNAIFEEPIEVDSQTEYYFEFDSGNIYSLYIGGDHYPRGKGYNLPYCNDECDLTFKIWGLV